jgi:DNA-binding transcriptional LysR family regulator
MDTNRLKQFCTIVETSNLRKAAELLGISHSGLSKSIKTLENELGLELIAQSGRGIVITDEGQRVYERSFDFFKSYKTLIGKENADKTSVIKLGSFEVFTTYFMGAVLDKYLPEIEIELHELVPGKLEEAILNRQIDVGVTYEPVPKKGIEYLKISQVKMGIFTSKNAFKKLDYQKIPFSLPITPLEGNPTGVKGLDGWPDDKFPRNEKYKVTMMESALELARRGKAAVFLPDFVARLHNETTATPYKLIGRELPKKMKTIKRDIYLVKRESSPEDFLMKKLARAIRETC